MRVLGVVFGLLQDIPLHWHLTLVSSGKDVLDLMYKQWLIVLFLSSPLGCEDGGEDETSQPSGDPAVRHAVQESKGGL